MSRRLLSLLAVVTLAMPSLSAVPVAHPGNGYIGLSMEVLSGADTIPLERALQHTGFRPQVLPIPNLGLGSSTVWVRMKVAPEPDGLPLVLSIEQSEIDQLEVFAVLADGRIQAIGHTGLEVSADQRHQRGREFAFDIPRSNAPLQLYMKLHSSKQLQLPAMIRSAQDHELSLQVRDHLLGAFTGAMLVMVLYNFFLFLSIRNRNYLLYVLYIISVTATQLAFMGTGPFHLWADNPWFATRATVFLTLSTAILAAEFLIHFIDSARHAPKLHRVIRWFYVPFIICICLTVAGELLLAYQLTQLISGLFATWLLMVVIKVWLNGSRQAGYFLIAWSGFLIGTMLFIMKDMGLIPYNMITLYAMPVGAAIEGVLLSFALADRINVLQREKAYSQVQALHMARENERIIRDQNFTLEEKVKERTMELQNTNDHLVRTQVQLVAAEKMASLGQLTAGIAHEINNPLNFISSNIPPLKRDLQDILELLAAHRQGPVTADMVHLAEQLGIDETIAEVGDIISSIEEGAVRTSQIVRGLRTFSRLDEDDLKRADLNEGIRSTVVVLSPQLRDSVALELLLGDIPMVECYPGKVNQVIMNVLNNAAQACKEKYGDQGGRIEVRTHCDTSDAFITITDNGPGIPTHVRDRMFEPFFTTKNVGEGTGLGLSIVHSIIAKHSGSIHVDCPPEGGTVFRIVLPLFQTSTAQRA